MIIALKAPKSKPVPVEKELTEEEQTQMRLQVAGLFEQYGFGGALVSFTYDQSASSVDLPQFRKIKSPFDLFKKHDNGTYQIH